MAVAAVGRPISRVLNAIAGQFGGPVSCDGHGAVGGDAIGWEIVASIGRSPAIRMR